jgi:hypothetical protein
MTNNHLIQIRVSGEISINGHFLLQNGCLNLNSGSLNIKNNGHI